MTLGQQRRTIAVSSMVVFGLGFASAAHRGEVPNARFFIGIGFTYTFISVFADMGAGDFGAGLAILILISAILYEGEGIVGLFQERANKGKVKVQKQGKKNAHKNSGSNLPQAENLENIDNEFEPLTRTQRLQRMGRTLRR